MMRCHIIVSLESIDLANHARWAGQITVAQICVNTGAEKGRPIAAPLKRKLLTEGKFAVGGSTVPRAPVM
jgi:hypothetical protein